MFLVMILTAVVDVVCAPPRTTSLLSTYYRTDPPCFIPLEYYTVRTGTILSHRWIWSGWGRRVTCRNSISVNSHVVESSLEGPSCPMQNSVFLLALCGVLKDTRPAVAIVIQHHWYSLPSNLSAAVLSSLHLFLLKSCHCPKFGPFTKQRTGRTEVGVTLQQY